MFNDPPLPTRDFFQVLESIMDVVPPDHSMYRHLEKVKRNAEFRAPERLHVSWGQLEECIYSHISIPRLEWQFMVIAIMSNRTVDAVKQILSPKKG